MLITMNQNQEEIFFTKKEMIQIIQKKIDARRGYLHACLDRNFQLGIQISRAVIAELEALLEDAKKIKPK